MGTSLMTDVLALADNNGVKKGSYDDADRECFFTLSPTLISLFYYTFNSVLS